MRGDTKIDVCAFIHFMLLVTMVVVYGGYTWRVIITLIQSLI